MRKKASHLFVFVLTLLLGFSVATKPAQAADTPEWIKWIKAQFNAQESSQNMENSITQEGVNSEKHVVEITSGLMNTINLHVLGPSGDNETSAMLREAIGPGLIATVNNGIVAMYEPPASAKTYVADLLQDAHIVSPAQAQGLGFASLDPVLETWKQFRNIAYLFFVVIFLVIGFMIMFRAKIGQAAITVQQALPNIIIALLAVTFSYAVAGFLIDLMYVLLYLISSLFPQGTDVINNNIFGLVKLLLIQEGFSQDVETVMSTLMHGLLETNWLAEGAAWISSKAGVVIVGIAILIATFKVFLELLKSYVSIILQVILAPVLLMTGAIPGKNALGSWIKNLVGNLLMWPVVMLCMVVNRMLTAGTIASAEDSVGGFMPPFLLGQGQGSLLAPLIGIGILIVIPEIMKEVKKALGVEEGIFSGLLGEGWKRIQKSFKVGTKAAGYGAMLPVNIAAGSVVGNIAGQNIGADFDEVGRERGGKIGRGIGIAAGVLGLPTKVVKKSAKSIGKHVMEGGVNASISNVKESYGLARSMLNKYLENDNQTNSDNNPSNDDNSRTTTTPLPVGYDQMNNSQTTQGSNRNPNDI